MNTTKAIILPNGRAVRLRSYVEAWKKLKATDPDIKVRGFHHFPEPAGRILREIEHGLHDRINIRGNCKPTGRKTSHDYERGLIQDRNDLEAINGRVRVYQFRTPEIRRRFGHLLSDRADL